jgi:hypothetical protein
MCPPVIPLTSLFYLLGYHSSHTGLGSSRPLDKTSSIYINRAADYINQIWPSRTQASLSGTARAGEEESFALLPLSHEQDRLSDTDSERYIQRQDRYRGLNKWDWITGEIPKSGDKMKFG